MGAKKFVSPHKVSSKQNKLDKQCKIVMKTRIFVCKVVSSGSANAIPAVRPPFVCVLVYKLKGNKLIITSKLPTLSLYNKLLKILDPCNELSLFYL